MYNLYIKMLQIACTWEDVKSLRQDMDKSSNQSSMLFRSKLLQAAAQMQVRAINFSCNFHF